MKILGSEITPYSTYLNRRKFIKGTFATALATTISSNVFANHQASPDIYNKFLGENDTINSYEEITTYNNFYEFGTHKKHPHLNSGNFNPNPWSIKLEGLINNPQTCYLCG